MMSFQVWLGVRAKEILRSVVLEMGEAYTITRAFRTKPESELVTVEVVRVPQGFNYIGDAVSEDREKRGSLCCSAASLIATMHV
jgi:hypothetical protein